MRIINRRRGSGKTTRLIYVSETMGIPIVVPSQKIVEYVEKQAHCMDAKIPKPITIRDLYDHGERYPFVVMDELDLCLNTLFPHTKIIAATRTGEEVKA